MHADEDVPGAGVVERHQEDRDAFAAELRDGIIWVEWTRSVTVDDADALALVARLEALSAEVCPPMLVVLNGMVSLSRSALQRLATGLNISAMALVGTSAVDSTLASFFKQVHHPPYPTRYFGNIRDARLWLTDHPFAG